MMGWTLFFFLLLECPVAVEVNPTCFLSTGIFLCLGYFCLFRLSRPIK